VDLPDALFSKGERGMIRFAVATITLTVLIGSFGLAQDATPKVQVFGGFSLAHADTGLLSGPTLDGDLREPNNTFGVATNFQGWNAEGQYNFDRWVGIVADFGGRSGRPITGTNVTSPSGLPNGNAYSILAGPVISYRTKSRMTPFVHALFGWDRTRLDASTITGVSSPVSSVATTYTDFAIALGGGLDVKVVRHVALRVGQVDWFHTSVNLNKFYGSAFSSDLFQGLATHQRNLRFSGGIVVSF
jgi:opacity protein-like surface antigen